MSFYNTIIQPEVWGKVIFSQASVILSRGGGLASQHVSQITKMGSASKGGLHLGGVIDKPLYYWDTMGYNQQTGSTHPPGMHSCFLMPLALQ